MAKSKNHRISDTWHTETDPASASSSPKFQRLPLVRPAIQVSHHLILFSASLASFLWLAAHRYGQWETGIDAAAFRFFGGWVSTNMTRAAQCATFMGTGSFLIPVYALIVVLFIRQGQVRKANMIILAVLLSFIAGCTLKLVFHFARPEHRLVAGAGGFSFPSGHALGGFTLGAVVFCLLSISSMRARKKYLIASVTMIIAVLIGMSRIYLRVHFAMDVIGSLLVAVCLSQLLMIYVTFTLRLPRTVPRERLKSLTS